MKLKQNLSLILLSTLMASCATTRTNERAHLGKSLSKPSLKAEDDLAVSKPMGKPILKDQMDEPARASTAQVDSKKLNIEPGLDRIEDDENADSEVIVQNGLVCVKEGSPQALQLSQILEASSEEEDLDRPLNDNKASQIGSIVIAENEPAVQQWVEYFSKKDKQRFSRFLERGSRYKDVISQILREEGVPQELYYLAMIESGFVTYAKSTASAVGVWQFVSGTGSRYGLRINSYVDERHDPIRSTRAAARYLASLYRVYQSWELAMAAYNAGEGRILGAIMRGHTRDFWELSKNGFLPRETADYVPKFMAAVLVGKDLKKFEFELNPDKSLALPVASIVPSGVKLVDVAAAAGISEKEVSDLNPHLRKGLTPPTANDKYYIWVPAGSDNKLASATEDLNQKRVKLRRDLDSNTASNGNSPQKGKIYRVRRGDSLASISAKYNISPSALRSMNRLRGTRVYVGQKLKLASFAEPSSSELNKSRVKRPSLGQNTNPSEANVIESANSIRNKSKQSSGKAQNKSKAG